MNSIDPSLAKYLSTSQQDILDTYHGKRGKGKRRKDPAGSNGKGLVIDDSNDVGWGEAGLNEDDEGGPGGSAHPLGRTEVGQADEWIMPPSRRAPYNKHF